MSIFDDDIKRLNFEDYIWIIFAILAFLNIYGDKLQKEFIYNLFIKKFWDYKELKRTKRNIKSTQKDLYRPEKH